MHRAYGTQGKGVAFFFNGLKPVGTTWVETTALANTGT